MYQCLIQSRASGVRERFWGNFGSVALRNLVIGKQQTLDRPAYEVIMWGRPKR